MPALTEGRVTSQAIGDIHAYPVEATAVLHAGGIGCLNAAGNAVAGSTSSTLTAIGRIEAAADNSAGAAGDVKIQFKEGDFFYDNSTAADEITFADVGKDCYIVDDQTVAKTDGAGSRSIAGKIINIEGTDVIVRLGFGA